jgi:hypothetical protein
MGDNLADGSTSQAHADETLSRELNKLVDSNPSALASINFYRAAPKACDVGSATIKPQLAIPTPFPKSPKPSGATNLGAVLDAVLNDVAGSTATIVIISDGGQSDRCGFHFCTVAEERLPGLSRIAVEQYWTPMLGGTQQRMSVMPATFVGWANLQCGAWRNEIALMENGYGETFEREGSERINTTRRDIAALLKCLSKLEKLIAGR